MNHDTPSSTPAAGWLTRLRHVPDQRWWPGLLFVLALIPRLPGLRLFLTTDEPYFAQQAARVVSALLAGDLKGTYWNFYPGVTMSWLDGLGLGGQGLWRRLAGLERLPLSLVDTQHGVLDFLVALRLPYVLLSAGFVVAVFVLARRLFDTRVATLGALLVAFEPFWLAHSRVSHGDGPVTVFMGVAVLALFVSLPTWSALKASRRRMLVLSGVAGGLAALTKAPGQFLALFVVLVAVEDWAITSWRGDRPDWRRALLWLERLAIWAGVAILVFVLLWPAMWVDPVGTLTRMLQETFGKVEEGHLVYFMGRPTLNPGAWFYPYVTALRLTPVALVGLLLSAGLIVQRFVRLQRWRDPALLDRRGDVAAALCWFFVLSLLLFGNVSPKKQDRYLLPIYPFVDLLAAYAWVEIADRLGSWLTAWKRRQEMTRARPRPGASRWTVSNGTRKWLVQTGPLVLLAVLLLVHAYPAVTAYPYYLAYFDPLLGGLPRAVHTTLVGWGEGMEQAAAYLNSRPDAANTFVAAVPSQTLLPYFEGTGENFYTNDVALRADQVVLYISQVQRLAPSPDIVRYFQAQKPEHVVTVLGQPYAWVYAGPKLISSEMPAVAQPVNVGFGDSLRLAGYRVAAEGDQIAVTLYWQALAPMSANYSVSVRLLDDSGTWLAQQDSWPADGLLPTPQWRQGDYVTDRHELPKVPDATGLEVVVYDAADESPLGAPLDLPLE